MTDTMYQEEGGTFTHHGIKYDLNKLFVRIHNRQAQKVEVKDLEWILKYSFEEIDGGMQCTSCASGPKNWHEQRLSNANTSVPIIVTKEKGTYFVLDGVHRLEKAIKLKIKEIPCILVTVDDLKQIKL